MANRNQSDAGTAAEVSWPSGPPTDALAEMLRTLELTVTRKLDGFLHGQYQGITPGHGSEAGESRMYQIGDDVRRIDWNVTARTRELYVRDQIADRDLEGWLVVDVSAGMRFSTVGPQKASIALGTAAAVGFLTARNQNRIGAVLVAGPEMKTFPPRPGKPQVRGILHAIGMPPESQGRGRADLAGALEHVGALSRRRGFVTIISDFLAKGWERPLGTLALRNDVLAVEIVDRRELDVPAVGYVALSDPATGAVREVHMTADLQARYRAAAQAQRETTRDSIRRAGADHLLMSTDGDWVGDLIQHVRRRKVQVAGVGGGLRRWIAITFLNGGRLWLLVVVAAMAAGYVATQFRRRRHVVTFTNIDLLDQLAPKRPGWRRHAVAACYLTAAVFGVIAIARPVNRTLQQTENGGRILLLFDVSLSMEATDVDPTRLDAARQAGKDFVAQVDDNIEVGLISFNGNVDVQVTPTLNHRQVSRAIDALRLGQGTAIGDALSVASDIIGPPDPKKPDQPAGVIVLLSDGETTAGDLSTAEGATIAADSKIPVYWIAFGTADGTVQDPNSGDTVPVPVNNDELSGVADTTGGKFFKAPSAKALDQAYSEISKNLNAGVGDPVTITDELTWQFVAFAMALLALGWVLGLVLLRSLL